MNLKNTSSEILDIFRIPLAIGVLCSHAYSGLAEHLPSNSIESFLDWISFYVLKICTNALPPLVVPGFFLLSGFFFFLKWKVANDEKIWSWSIYREKLHKRIFTLLIPYILWNIIPVFLGLIGSVFDNNGSLIDAFRSYMQGKGLRIFWSFYNNDTSDTYIFGIPLSISTAPFNFPLYYLRDLIGICVLSPLVFYFVKKLKAYGLVALSILGVYNLIPSYPGVRSSAVLFFTIGAYFSINNIDIVEKLKGKIWPLQIATIAILCLIVLGKCPSVLQNIYVFLGLLLCLRLIYCLANKYHLSSPKNVINGIFFFYAAHEGLYILPGVQEQLCRFFPTATYSSVLINYILTICMTFIFCYIIRSVILRLFPRIGKLLGA